MSHIQAIIHLGLKWAQKLYRSTLAAYHAYGPKSPDVIAVKLTYGPYWTRPRVYVRVKESETHNFKGRPFNPL